jgi:hypothetical protein
MMSFQMELEHLISREVLQRTILGILLRNGLEYDSDDVDYYSPSYEYFHILQAR